MKYRIRETTNDQTITYQESFNSLDMAVYKIREYQFQDGDEENIYEVIDENGKNVFSSEEEEFESHPLRDGILVALLSIGTLSFLGVLFLWIINIIY